MKLKKVIDTKMYYNHRLHPTVIKKIGESRTYFNRRNDSFIQEQTKRNDDV